MTQQVSPAAGRDDEGGHRPLATPSPAPRFRPDWLVVDGVPPGRTLSARAAVRVLSTDRPSPGLLAAWDRLVSERDGSDVAQLPSWANLRAERAGFTPWYLLARSAGRLVGGALVLRRRIPMLGVAGYLPYGPVLAADEPREPMVDALARALHHLGTTQLSGLFVQPPAGAGDVTRALTAVGFRPSAAGIAPDASLEIDLSVDVEAIRAGFTRSNRRRTRTGADRGITVRRGGEPDLPLIADLLASTAAHQRFDPAPVSYLRALHRELGERVAMFVAELDGEPVAAEVCTGCGGVLKSRLTGMRRDERTCRSGVSAVLIWHVVLWAKAQGYHTFDVGGITTDTADALEAGARPQLSGPAAFKSSFGGRVLRYPGAVELVSGRLLRTGYDLSRRSRIGHSLIGTARKLLRGGVGAVPRIGQSGSSSR